LRTRRVSVGAGERFTKPAQDPAGFEDKAREVFPDPGASKMRSENERSLIEQWPLVRPHPFRM